MKVIGYCLAFIFTITGSFVHFALLWVTNKVNLILNIIKSIDLLDIQIIIKESQILSFKKKKQIIKILFILYFFFTALYTLTIKLWILY